MAIKTRKALTLFAGASVVALCMTTNAFAQDAPPQQAAPQDGSASGLEDIVVTAQRRSERLQDVPISVSAVTASEMQSKGVTSTLDLVQIVPSVVMNSVAGATQVRIRGVGTTNFGPGVENPVAMYIDGVYIASTSAAFFNLSNIERVETLKGPQGTLFGRNATGGLIQIVTPEPSDTLKGFIKAGYGNYDTLTGDAYVSGPLGENVSADLAVHYGHEGKGWGRNIHTGNYVNQITDDLIVRSKVKVQATDNFKLIFAGDYSLLKGSRPVTIQQVPGTIGGFDRIYYPASSLPVNHGGYYDNDSNLDPYTKIQSGGGSLTASLQVGDAEIKSITAYRTTRMDAGFNLTRVPFDVLRIDLGDKWDQFSQELQVSGQTGRLKYTGGVYYFDSIDKYDPFYLRFGRDFAPISFPGSIDAVQQFNNRLHTKSISGYVQGTYEIFTDTNVTLGGRYTDERKVLGGTQSLSVTYPAPTGTVFFVPVGTPYAAAVDPRLHNTNFSYRIALDHKFSQNIMGYVSYNTGFKSGGYNLTTPDNPSFKPEKLKAFEVGLKTELFDRHLRFNVSAFHYDYTDMQVNNFVTTSPFIVNGGKSKIDGFEIESEARIAPGLTISAGLAYANARFTDFPNAGYNYVVPGCTPTGNVNTPCLKNAKGNKIPNTPEFTGNIGFGYEHSFDDTLVGLTGNVYHTSSTFGNFDNDPRSQQRGYELVNGSIYLEPGKSGFRFTLWAKNIFKVQYSQVLYISSQQPTLQAGGPRTFGITAQKTF